MKFYGKQCFEDLLEDGPVELDGIMVDTQVEMIVARTSDGDYEIDSTSFGEKDVYILPPGALYQVKIGKEENHVFLKKLSDKLERIAIKRARDLPMSAWDATNPIND